jgi:MFS transporter, FSR family, fosmidomycin resistance protein
VVYGGMDVGQALVPLLIGSLMDHQHYREVFLVMAMLQAVLVANAFSVRRVRRAPSVVPAPG